jgi:hypothetical protein
MPRRSHGDTLLKLIPQPGRQLVYKQDGSISGQVKYKVDGSRAIALVPRIGAPHPDNPRVQCYNSTVSLLENGIAEIVSDYLGISRDPTPAQIEFVGNTGEDPVDTHKDFVAKIGGNREEPKNKAQFDVQTGEFVGFPPDAPQNLGGVRGYLSPACTVRVTFFTSASDWGLWSLGEIASPPGNVPRPPDSRNWLKTNWSRRDFGLIYQITEEYTASGRRGWNRLLYG